MQFICTFILITITIRTNFIVREEIVVFCKINNNILLTNRVPIKRAMPENIGYHHRQPEEILLTRKI